MRDTIEINEKKELLEQIRNLREIQKKLARKILQKECRKTCQKE